MLLSAQKQVRKSSDKTISKHEAEHGKLLAGRDSRGKCGSGGKYEMRYHGTGSGKVRRILVMAPQVEQVIKLPGSDNLELVMVGAPRPITPKYA